MFLNWRDKTELCPIYIYIHFLDLFTAMTFRYCPSAVGQEQWAAWKVSFPSSLWTQQKSPPTRQQIVKQQPGPTRWLFQVYGVWRCGGPLRFEPYRWTKCPDAVCFVFQPGCLWDVWNAVVRPPPASSLLSIKRERRYNEEHRDKNLSRCLFLARARTKLAG